jgi:hypothetical protein
MGRIAKKPRSVKGQKAGKPAPRYAIRKDSLGRRYAIDKRTGKRASVSKAEKERQKLKKAAQQFRGIKPPKAPKPPKAVKPSKAKRTAAAKKGWETRKAKQQPPLTRAEKVAQAVADVASGKRTVEEISESERPSPKPIVAILGALIPEGMRMRVVDGLLDRVEQYPRVKAAADNAWNILQRDSYAHSVGEGPTMAGSQFDKDHGKGAADYIRYEVFARARDIQDVEQLVEDIIDTDDDYSARELYTLFFSPDVA